MKNRVGRKRCFLWFGLFIGKLQRGLPLFSYSRLPSFSATDDMEEAMTVPLDVKKGHFAVFAVKGGETKRFVIELEHLTNPAFLSLLELAKEEYGFSQKGVLAVPCRPEELRRILRDRMLFSQE